MVKRLLVATAAILLIVGAYLLISNGRQSSQPLQVAPQPPPEVGVVAVHPAEVPFPVEYPGRVVGLREVEVRSLVGGILLKRGFEEGARVTQGQTLFQIDPAPYEVARKRAEAQLAKPKPDYGRPKIISREPRNSFAAVFRRRSSEMRARRHAIKPAPLCSSPKRRLRAPSST